MRLESEQLANAAVDILSERLALEIALVDISRTATFTDYFVIGTAQSPLQFAALQEHLEKGLTEMGASLRHTEGTAAGGWVLMDFGDLIIHIFTAERRAHYRIEELWGRTSPVVRFAD